MVTIETLTGERAWWGIYEEEVSIGHVFQHTNTTDADTLHVTEDGQGGHVVESINVDPRLTKGGAPVTVARAELDDAFATCLDGGNGFERRFGAAVLHLILAETVMAHEFATTRGDQRACRLTRVARAIPAVLRKGFAAYIVLNSGLLSTSTGEERPITASRFGKDAQNTPHPRRDGRSPSRGCLSREGPEEAANSAEGSQRRGMQKQPPNFSRTRARRRRSLSQQGLFSKWILRQS